MPWVLLFAAASAFGEVTFKTVRDVIFADPYDRLPHYEVSPSLLGPSGDNEGNRLREAARRTLTSSADLLEFPTGQKLFQPNGICFSGRWEIERPSPYTGYFAQGSRGLLIARASVSLSETEAGSKRAFAIAGKLFPTLNESTPVATANFFAMENMLGTKDRYFLDATLDNNPVVSGLPGSFRNLMLGLRIRKDLISADSELSETPGDIAYRPLYPISELGAPHPEDSVTPYWMQLRIQAETPRADQLDFRDELRLEHYPNEELVWEVWVAAHASGGKSKAAWRRIGTITFDDYVISKSCDTRLHFAHPVLRKPSP